MTTQVRKILSPVDFSPGSREAMRRAAELAIQNKAALLVVHVAETQPWVGATELPFSGDSLQQMVNAEDANLAAAAQEARALGVASVTSLTLAGAPADAIVAAATEDPEVDLIVMGTHGRTGLRHAVLGSVAEKVVRLAPCDVLITRKRE